MIMGFISLFIALFLVLSRLVNRRMTINGYTPLQAIFIIIFSLPLSFFLLKQRSNLCYDNITFAMGSRNGFCELQGLFLVFGYHSIVLCLVARGLSVFLLVVYKKNIPRVYLTVFIILLSSVFAGLSSSKIRFNGGSMCAPAHHTMRQFVQIPVLAYSIVGLVLQFATSWYVTKSMAEVRLSILRSQIPDDLHHKHSHLFSWRTKISVWASCHIKAVRMLWRTYLICIFLGSTMIFAAVQYLISTTHNMGNTRLATQEWIACVITTNQTPGFNGDISQCKQFLQGAGMYARMLVGMLLMLGFSIIFLFTELRMYLLLSWYNLLKAGPKALLSRKKSDAILDTIVDDELSKVWLPERLQNKFFSGSWHRSVQDEQTMKRDLERQLHMYTERKELENSTQENHTNCSSSSGGSIDYSATIFSSNNMGNNKAKTSFKTALPLVAEVRRPAPAKVCQQPNYHYHQESTSVSNFNPSVAGGSGGVVSGLSNSSHRNWIKSFMSSTEQRQKRNRKRQLQMKRAKQHSKRKRRMSATSSLTRLRTNSVSSSAECISTVVSSSSLALFTADYTTSSVTSQQHPQNLNNIEEEDEQLDFLSFLNSSRPPPRR